VFVYSTKYLELISLPLTKVLYSWYPCDDMKPMQRWIVVAVNYGLQELASQICRVEIPPHRVGNCRNSKALVGIDRRNGIGHLDREKNATWQYNRIKNSRRESDRPAGVSEKRPNDSFLPVVLSVSGNLTVFGMAIQLPKNHGCEI